MPLSNVAYKYNNAKLGISEQHWTADFQRRRLVRCKYTSTLTATVVGPDTHVSARGLRVGYQAATDEFIGGAV